MTKGPTVALSDYMACKTCMKIPTNGTSSKGTANRQAAEKKVQNIERQNGLTLNNIVRLLPVRLLKIDKFVGPTILDLLLLNPRTGIYFCR